MDDSAGSRVSVEDRERALLELSHHLGSGRLDLAEFDERSAAVTAATTKTQLAELFADLPGSLPSAAPLPEPNPMRTLVVTVAAIAVLALAAALVTGTWWPLLVTFGAPAALALAVRTGALRP
ncbi:DUF1707 domain-containing protein [Nocardia sp. CWNU-33]|uniref:DUF1707 SHOCT-like domain-containing protein n=1 Tax=Nocardia sp. CWNU-33 TaxID=3392117 RepID=UPI00398F8CB3